MSIRLWSVFGFVYLAACGPATDTAPPSTPDKGPLGSNSVRSQPAADEDETLVIFLGDSLTAGYELDEDQAFPAHIDTALREAGHNVRIVNAGISGDTTAGGLARLDWLLGQQPDVLFVGLGGNDGLRGMPLETSEANLRAIIERATATGTRVLLAGMLIPPNYGSDYTEAFAAIYPRLARELDVPLIPFLLAGVAARPELNLPDGIHPNAEGQRIVAETVLQHLEPLLTPISGEQSPESE